MLCLRNQEILPKNYFNTSRNATAARFCRNWFKKRNLWLKLTINNGRRKVCVNYQKDTAKLNFVVCRYRNDILLKDSEMELTMTEYEKLPSKRVYLSSYIDSFFMQCIVLDETTVHRKNFVRNGCLFSHGRFPNVSGINFLIWTQECSKKTSSTACFCWDSRLSLRQMDQKFKIGGTIGYSDSFLEFLFRHF